MHRPQILVRIALFTMVACILLSSTAQASPWILPEGVTVFSMTMGAQSADHEYLPDGDRRAFPLNGRFDSYFLQLEGRRGMGNDFELSARALLKGVSYTSDPLILPVDDFDTLTRPEVQDNTVSFSQSALGLGDIYLGGGYQHLASSLRLSSVVEVKLPTGYASPRETFLGGDPDRIGDDVTLGDGQLDLQYAIQAGYVIDTSRTLIELDLGYRKRFQGPGDQAFGTLKLGQSLHKRVFAFLGTNADWTLFKGEPIGEGLIARDPTIAARDFTADNVQRIPLTLDRSFVQLEGGVILKFEGREILLHASRTLIGKNYPELTTLSVGSIMVFE